MTTTDQDFLARASEVVSAATLSALIDRLEARGVISRRDVRDIYEWTAHSIGQLHADGNGRPDPVIDMASGLIAAKLQSLKERQW